MDSRCPLGSHFTIDNRYPYVMLYTIMQKPDHYAVFLDQKYHGK